VPIITFIQLPGCNGQIFSFISLLEMFWMSGALLDELDQGARLADVFE
jgi:hypothetical protein